MNLKELCNIHAPSGSEWRIKEYLLDYIKSNKRKWKHKASITSKGIKDNLILSFGKPRIAIFCHFDTTGFTVRYNNSILNIGSPVITEKDILKTINEKGEKQTFKVIKDEDNNFRLDSNITIKPGTVLSFGSELKSKGNLVSGPYLDNRAGLWVMLKVAEEIKNGLLVFTSYEEHGGGSVEFLAPYIYNVYGISQSIICDMTWESEAVKMGKGLVVSLRDRYIPRQRYIETISDVLTNNRIKLQFEVEGSGSSDGGYLQKSSVPFDWCFTGIPLKNMHSSCETANMLDLQELIKALLLLSKKL